MRSPWWGSTRKWPTPVKVDFGRLGAQVISGIGFLGAGTILQRKGSIKGLTTAATLWLVACIGLAVGMGYYWIVGIGLALVLVVLIASGCCRMRFPPQQINLEIRFFDKKKSMEAIQSYLDENRVAVQNIEFLEDEGEGACKGKRLWLCCYTVRLPRALDFQTLQRNLLMADGILRVTEAVE